MFWLLVGVLFISCIVVIIVLSLKLAGSVHELDNFNVNKPSLSGSDIDYLFKSKNIDLIKYVIYLLDVDMFDRHIKLAIDIDDEELFQIVIDNYTETFAYEARNCECGASGKYRIDWGINKWDSHYWETPIYNMIRRGDNNKISNVFKYMVEVLDADLNCPCQRNDCYPLFFALREKKSLLYIKYMVEHGAGVTSNYTIGIDISYSTVRNLVQFTALKYAERLACSKDIIDYLKCMEVK